MKKTLLSLVIAATSFSSFAAVVLNEPFSYADGSITSVSGGVWANHSGTAGQVDVTSGKVNLSQSESEDVNAQLSGSPYSSGNLYASFVVNFSTLPSGSGTYFAHFKDATSSGFRGRVFAVTTGAASGTFRLAIANSATPVAIEKDLSLNTDYVVVMRYDPAAVASTLWINPGSETATGDRADATDSVGPIAISTFGLRQANSMGILTLDDLKVGTAFTDVVTGGNPDLNPPTISNILDQNVPANTPTAAIPFEINDGETAAANLTLSKESFNTTLIPLNNIVFGGSGNDRTVTITPTAGQQGTTTIKVTVTDGNANSASREFAITVGTPNISAINNQSTSINIPTEAIPFTVGDTESAAGSLTVTATSSDEAVVPSANINLGGSGANRTVTITPAQDAVGLVGITLTVSDGINEVSTVFSLTVSPQFGLDFEDDFSSYQDGSIVTNSSFVWNTHSASTNQAGQTQVTGGKLFLNGGQSEDIHRFLSRTYETNSGAILYSKFTVVFTELPSGDGYFAHFRDTGSGFRARVYASVANAASGSFRLGISNGGNTFDQLPTDLSLNTTYTVVTRYNVGTGESTLWVNPLSEASPSVSGTDNTFPQWIWTYAFRQTPGLGSLVIDDLKIGTAFSDVVEVVALPPALTIATVGNDIEVSWPVADSEGYALQSKTDLNSASWTPAADTPVVSGDRNVVTISAGTGNRFFRLSK